MHMFLLRASRLVQANTLRTRPVSRVCPRRLLHASPPRRAAEDPDSFIANVKNSAMFRQLADKPEALQAISKLVNLMQAKGVDMSSGRPPSTMTMFKLAADSEFREAAKTVAAELEKAGIDLKNKDTLDAIMRLRDGKP